LEETEQDQGNPAVPLRRSPRNSASANNAKRAA
jgi:hypothetical protein